MKIEEVIKWHRALAAENASRREVCAPNGERWELWNDEFNKHVRMADSLEQHHKDLMGLVEAWRECAEVTMYEDRSIDFRQCADDLESLINPKD